MRDPFSILLRLSYHGYSFFGWSKQKNLPTIEEILRSTWEHSFHFPIRAFASSRTDAQVHALDQWIKIIAKEEITLAYDQIHHQLNDLLPSDIRVLEVKSCEKGFNIIGSATSKQYCYLFCNVLPTNLERVEEKILQFNEPLDLALMQEAAKLFLGTHNFYNFQRRESPGAQLIREVTQSEIVCISEWLGSKLDRPIYCYNIQAKGFLRQMVRIIVGAILNVGQGRVSLEELRLSLESKGDTKYPVGFVSPGYGLYLKKITF